MITQFLRSCGIYRTTNVARVRMPLVCTRIGVRMIGRPNRHTKSRPSIFDKPEYSAPTSCSFVIIEKVNAQKLKWIVFGELGIWYKFNFIKLLINLIENGHHSIIKSYWTFLFIFSSHFTLLVCFLGRNGYYSSLRDREDHSSSACQSKTVRWLSSFIIHGTGHDAVCLPQRAPWWRPWSSSESLPRASTPPHPSPERACTPHRTLPSWPPLGSLAWKNRLVRALSNASVLKNPDMSKIINLHIK